MNTMPREAFEAQASMERQMRVQSLGPTAYVLVRDVFNAVELPPDLEARVLGLIEFVEQK